MRLLARFKRQLNILFGVCVTTTFLIVTVYQHRKDEINFIQYYKQPNGAMAKTKALARKERKDNENYTDKKLPPDFPTNFGNLWRPLTNQEDDRILKQRQWIEAVVDTKFFQQLKPKKILVLDGFYSYFGHDGQLNCPSTKFETKCQLKEDNWYTGFYRNFEEWDAVVTIRNWVFRLFESRIMSTTRQIIFTVESPYVTLHADLHMNNAILASYWRSSDISEERSPRPRVNNSSDSDSKHKNYAKAKKKLAAIVTSDCTPENRRLDYVKELQKYVQVDIYGKCGTLECDPHDCFGKLKEDYKFYLSFERCNCRDYITEKFFYNALQHDMVPVTLGAHKKDYLAAAPPGSFIHVEDFPSPWHLASYLTHLDENDEEYNAYFAWKNLGEFLDPLKDLFCRICGLLIYEDFVPSPVWPPGSTWKTINKCLLPGKLFWDR